jgi:hypothetical protein
LFVTQYLAQPLRALMHLRVVTRRRQAATAPRLLAAALVWTLQPLAILTLPQLVMALMQLDWMPLLLVMHLKQLEALALLSEVMQMQVIPEQQLLAPPLPHPVLTQALSAAALKLQAKDLQLSEIQHMHKPNIQPL